MFHHHKHSMRDHPHHGRDGCGRGHRRRHHGHRGFCPSLENAPSQPDTPSHNVQDPLEYHDTVLPPVDAAMPAATHIRFFVCVGRHCRNASAGRMLIDALQAAIAKRGTPGIDVHSCGCQDMCEKGPVVLVYRGAAAQKNHPPKGTLEKLWHRPLATYLHANAEQAEIMLDTAISKRKGR